MSVLVGGRNETFSGHHDLVVEDCCVCGVLFAMPAALRAMAARNHDRWFWCPNGHTQHFTGPTEAQKLAVQLERERDRSAYLRADRDQAQAHAKAQKGRATRFRNDRDRERARSAAGVCPCCNRTFKQLARHMAGQHPEFPPAGGGE